MSRLASRSTIRTEADIQSDIAMLLLAGGLDLEDDQVVKLESQVGDGTRRRIDVEVGRVVIEAKKDLRKPAIVADAESQLAGDLRQRQLELESNFAGILTDGTIWRLYRLGDTSSELVSELKLSEQAPDAERLLAWLESIMATRDRIKPTTAMIEELLGANSPGHELDHAALMRLLAEAVDDTEVQLKRELWAKLLRTALGDAFDDDDEKLFVNHTLLVITAVLVASPYLELPRQTGQAPHPESNPTRGSAQTGPNACSTSRDPHQTRDLHAYPAGGPRLGRSVQHGARPRPYLA